MTKEEVWFFSKSKDEKLRWLSNFTCYDTKSIYPSIEAKFQAMKFCYSNKPNHHHSIEWEKLSPSETRKYGSKSYFKKHNIILDIQKWNENRISIMRELLLMRWKDDKQFQSILKEHKNKSIFHWSLRDKFWGCYRKKDTKQIIGDNMLGKLMMDIVK